MDELLPLIVSIATLHGLDPLLVEAVVTKESSGNPFAWNPEPQYRYLWDVKKNAPFRALTAAEGLSEIPPADFPFLAGDRDQEWWGQQASWGLMQVMGAVAREHGYRDPYLPSLCQPVQGLAYGCKHLAKAIKRTAGATDRALSIYNSGRPDSAQGAAYAVAVQAIYNRLKSTN